MEAPVQLGEILLGKYQVEHVLGQGGMAVVVAARHVSLGELFAIKLLLPQSLESREVVSRFVREARAAARLKGDHVVRVHDVGQLESGAPYMVMEHLEGCDLHALSRTRGPLPVEEAAGYVLQACEAIAEAHALGIVHRDLKPANLFLARRPQGPPCVKVLDFGISKQTAGPEGELTKTGALLGTPFYMSPEQMTQTKTVDARADVWALGVILYKLITGQLPFHGSDLTTIIARVLQEEPPAPSQVRPGLPAHVDAVVLRCLQKRQELRFQSVADLSSALREMVGAGTGAGTAAWPRVTTPTPAGPVQWSGTTPAPITPIPMGATGAAWGQTQPQARNARSRAIRTAVLGGAMGLLVVGGVGAWWALRWEPGARAAAGPAQSSEGALEATSAAPAEGPPPATPGQETQPREDVAPVEAAPVVAVAVQTPSEGEEAAAPAGEVTPRGAAAPANPAKGSGKPTGPRHGDGHRVETRTSTPTPTSAKTSAPAAPPAAKPSPSPKPYQGEGLF